MEILGQHSALVDLLEQVQIPQDERRALQDRDGKTQAKAHLQYPPRDLELFLGCLVVAGPKGCRANGDDVHRQPAQGFAQELGGVFLDLDDIAKVAKVIEGAVLPLPTVAVLPDTTDKAPSP